MYEQQIPERPTRPPSTRPRRDARARANSLALKLAFASLLSLAGCAERAGRVENAPATPQPASNASNASAPNANAQATQTAQTAAANSNSAPPAHAAPQPSEIADKAAHIFGGAVELDATEKTPALVGDFNGDGSEDVAFAVRPTQAGLAEINSEVSNWILVDPQQVVLPDPHRAVQKLPPPVHTKAEAGDHLLAVIHGYGAQGWRDAAARQTYLLRNAVGRDARVAARDDASSRLNLRFRGDVIEQQLGGARGLLEWTGATYAWLAEKR